MTVVSRPEFPARDIASYLELIRKEGGKLNLANTGLGSSSHLCGMLIQQAAGATATSIAYRGSAQITTELMAGRVDIFCDQITNTMPYIRDKRFPAYAVTSEARVSKLDVPTMAEAGKPAATMTAWHGLFAPAGVPDAILDRLSAALRAALKEEKLQARFAGLVTAPASQERATRAFHKRFHAEEVARWRTVVQAAGLTRTERSARRRETSAAGRRRERAPSSSTGRTPRPPGASGRASCAGGGRGRRPVSPNRCGQPDGRRP